MHLTLLILYGTEVDITYQVFDPGNSIAFSSYVALSAVATPCDKQGAKASFVFVRFI